MGQVILDSSVLLAVLDPEDALHAPATSAMREARAGGDGFVIPASVLAEVLVGAARQGTDVAALLESRIDALVGDVRNIDRQVARTTASLRAAHPAIRLPDALVIATGRVDNASSVLTADKKWRGVDERVTVIGLEEVAPGT